MTDPNAAELELKLRLSRQSIRALRLHPALLAVVKGRVGMERLAATYFDTDDRRLSAAGIGLRLRRNGRQWVMTVKGPADARSGGGLTARPEYEWPIGTTVRMPALDFTRLVTTPWRSKLAKASRRGLVPVFTTAVSRTTLPLTFEDGTTASFAIDVGEIRDAMRGESGGPLRRTPISEIEIELGAGSVSPLFALARSLAADLPVMLEPDSKAARGYALVDALRRVPQRAENVELGAKESTEDALRGIVRACLRQVEGNADGLIAHDDAEWIHQMRIGTRRLRACLSLMRDVAPETTLAALADEAGWLADALGSARDLDVMAHETLVALGEGLRGMGDPTGTPALRSLRARVARRRKLARAAAREAVASARFVRFVLATGEFAATPRFGSTDEHAIAGLAQPAQKFASPLLAKRHHKLVKRAVDLPRATPEAQHAARIAAKKVRYATEFFAPLYPRKRARAFRTALADLQDLLGALNDARVGLALTKELAGPSSAATATMQGFAAATRAQRAEALADAWDKFVRCRPFWGTHDA